MIFRDHLTSHGVILLRLGELALADRLARLEEAWPTAERHPAGKFLVISPTKVRVRDLGMEAGD